MKGNSVPTYDLAVHYCLRLADHLTGIKCGLNGGGNLERVVVEADRAEHDARALRRVAQKMIEQQVRQQK
jgi:hypothetical protein